MPSFRDVDDVYYADNCAPLTAAVAAGQLTMQALVRGHYPGAPLRDGEVPGIRTIGYWDASQHQNWGLDWHRNEGIEITYLARGQLDFAVDDREWPLRSGQLTITRPWQKHRVGDPDVGPSRLHWCILDVDVRRPNQKWKWPSWLALSAEDLRRLTQLLQHNEHPVWPANRDLDETFEALAQVAFQPGFRTRHSRLRQLVSRLLLDVELEKQSLVLDEELSSARRSVQLFLFRTRELPRPQVDPWTNGRQLRPRPDALFTQYCQAITNMSPLEYLTSLRLRRAAELIRGEPNLQFTDIAFRCGYESSQYFSAAFSKHHGMSPRAYQRVRLSEGTART